MIIVAAVLTFLFKKDKDATSFEADLGKMVQGDRDLMPANKGDNSSVFTHACVHYLFTHV